MAATITLLTDFGPSTHYPGVMKGVVLSRCPQITLVDITHEVPAFSIKAAAFLLTQTVPRFLPPVVHLVVVDPGVGTDRAAIAVKMDNGVLLVGPDNGVFSWVLKGRSYQAFRLPIPGDTSLTFHGRDVFAPAAADLACGKIDPDSLQPMKQLITMPFPGFNRTPQGIRTKVLYLDAFGNLLLPIPKGVFPPQVTLKLHFHGKKWSFSFGTYGNMDAGGLCWHYDSSGFLELAASGTSLRGLLGIDWNDEVFLTVGGS